MCYAQSHTVDDWHTDSTFLEKPGSNICYLSNSADRRGHENTGKVTRKADEKGMPSADVVAAVDSFPSRTVIQHEDGPLVPG